MYNSEWEDFYNPVDYLGAADKEALEYLDSHPDADKRAVKRAAEDFALAYEYSDSLRQKSFKNQLFIAMKTADYNSKKRRKESEEMGKHLKLSQKQAVISDMENSELTLREAAEKYGTSRSTVMRIMKEYREDPEKFGFAGACIEEAAAPEEPPTVEFYENGFPVEYEAHEPTEEAEKAEPKEEPEPIEDDGADFLAVLEELKDFASEVFPGSYVLESFASNVKNFAGIQFVDGTGRTYLLKIEEKAEDDRDDF